MKPKRPFPRFGPSIERALAATEEVPPQLQYAMSPDYGTVSQPNVLHFIVTNSSAEFSVAFRAGADVISVRDWGGLTKVPDQITPVPPPDTPWQAAMADGTSGKYVKIWVIEDVTIPPRGKVEFTVGNVVFDDTVGRVALSVVEFIDSKRALPPPINIGKLGAEMQIVASADPLFVGKGQVTKIVWTIVGGEWVIVQPPEESPKYPRQGTGPWSASADRFPFQDQRQTQYMARVFETGGKERKDAITVTISSPVVLRFEPKSAPPLAIDQEIEMQWQTRYATSVMISTSAVPVPKEGKRKIVPGRYLATNKSDLELILVADGYLPMAEARIQFKFLPLVVNWFRYATFAKDSFIFQLSNSQSNVIAPISGKPNAWRLQATGPGGPITQELGSDGLEIQVITSEKQPDNSYLVKYLVQKASKLFMDGTELRFDDKGMGSTVVKPASTTTYEFVAQGDGGRKLTSYFVLEVKV